MRRYALAVKRFDGVMKETGNGVCDVEVSCDGVGRIPVDEASRLQPCSVVNKRFHQTYLLVRTRRCQLWLQLYTTQHADVTKTALHDVTHQYTTQQ